MAMYISLAAVALLLLYAVWFFRHQKSLRRRAEMMREAVRNHDFMFRLPTRGMPSGERAMQEALNQLGATIQQQAHRNEVEAWERLTRVLTHEIMNAIAPIASLSQSMLNRNDVKGTPLEEGIRAIHDTSAHLNTFVDSYRKLSQLQEPKPKAVALLPLLSDLQQLYGDVSYDSSVGTDIPSVLADPGMLRQVFINLMKNAVEAGARRIGFAAQAKADSVSVFVSNNGQPITAEAISSIFVPFYTTKRTGNGVGLSLSRRMMVQQDGSLELAKQPQAGYHTTFIIQLPRA